MRSKSISFLFLITILSLAACSSSSDDSTSTSTSSADDLGGSVGAVFSGAGSSSISEEASIPKYLLDFLVKKAHAEGECSTTCSCLGADGPDNITTANTGTAGTYGADTDTTNTMTVTADHFCSVSSSATGGPDSAGQFATFDFSASVTATCTAADSSTSTTTISAGSGIWRNTDTHMPEVYGSFTADGAEYDCTIMINTDDAGTVDGENSNCVDADGVEAAIDDGVTCTIDA